MDEEDDDEFSASHGSDTDDEEDDEFSALHESLDEEDDGFSALHDQWITKTLSKSELQAQGRYRLSCTYSNVCYQLASGSVACGLPKN